MEQGKYKRREASRGLKWNRVCKYGSTIYISQQLSEMEQDKYGRRDADKVLKGNRVNMEEEYIVNSHLIYDRASLEKVGHTVEVYKRVSLHGRRVANSGLKKNIVCMVEERPRALNQRKERREEEWLTEVLKG